MIRLSNGSGSGPSNFKWTASEQVWPFELWNDGSTLYCKEVNMGLLPNNGAVTYPLTSVYSGLTTEKIYSFKGIARNGAGRVINLPNPTPVPHEVCLDCLLGSLYVTTTSNAWTAFTGYVKIIYKH